MEQSLIHDLFILEADTTMSAESMTELIQSIQYQMKQFPHKFSCQLAKSLNRNPHRRALVKTERDINKLRAHCLCCKVDIDDLKPLNCEYKKTMERIMTKWNNTKGFISKSDAENLLCELHANFSCAFQQIVGLEEVHRSMSYYTNIPLACYMEDVYFDDSSGIEYETLVQIIA